jgi:hypothetical protein
LCTPHADPADLEAGFWYFYYFLTEHGRAGLTANRQAIAKVVWTRNSPNWHFDVATLDRAAVAFDNPDDVEVVLHSYQHRLGFAPSDPPYDQLEQQLAALPAITVPAVTWNWQRLEPIRGRVMLLAPAPASRWPSPTAVTAPTCPWRT